MAGELAAEWIRVPDGNGGLKKVWIRDSTARRDIAQLQTDVSGKADAATTLAGYGITDAYTKTQVDDMIPSVPSAYTSNPEMDGTASPGSSAAWARGDHVHPHDSTKADVSAIPTKTSDLTNDSGFITSAPVASVNGQTGAVSLDASDVGALPDSTVIPSKTSDLTNDSGFITDSAVPDPSSAAPAMDGTAAVGSSTDYARADHVHPSDTSKQDVPAINDASVLFTVSHIVPTLTNGTHYTSWGGCFYYKIGSRVHVHIGVSGLTAATDTTLWNLPAGYRPAYTCGTVGIASTMARYSRCKITTAGNVVVNTSAGEYALCDIEFEAEQ